MELAQKQTYKNETIQDVIAGVNAGIKSNLKTFSTFFIERYFSNVAPDDLLGMHANELTLSLLGYLEFIETREKGKAKIRLVHEKVEIHTGATNHTVVEIVNDDMPFLVDSLSAAINNLGYTLDFVVHPVLKVKRNSKGGLEGLYPKDQDVEGAYYESFIRCQISERLSQKQLKALETELINVFNDVRLAVRDWRQMMVELDKSIVDLKSNRPKKTTNETIDESLEFLEWLKQNNFTFLGYCQYDLGGNPEHSTGRLNAGEGLGVLHDIETHKVARLFQGIEITPQNIRFLLEAEPIIITKTSDVSLVHRRDPMDSINIKRYDDNGNVIGITQFLGLFTSVVYKKSAREIPILRRKIQKIIEQSGFSQEWHDGKALIHILESFPRDELFQGSLEWLSETSISILQLQNRQRPTLFLRSDKFGRTISCLVYVPRDRYDTELRLKIESILKRELNATTRSWNTELGELAFARAHFVMLLQDKAPEAFNKDKIEIELIEATLTWKDRLRTALNMSHGEVAGIEILEEFGQAFSKGYQENVAPEESVLDIEEIQKTVEENKIRIRLFLDTDHPIRFKIYSPQEAIPLSQILPVLEKLDFHVISERPYKVSLDQNQKVIWVQEFEIVPCEKPAFDMETLTENFLDAFQKIWRDEVENDGFNRLIIRAGLTWKEAQILRAYSKYLWQLRVNFSQSVMEETLLNHGAIVRHFIQLFYVRFDPCLSGDRKKQSDEILGIILKEIDEVSNPDEDRLLRRFLNLLTSTIRTNYFLEAEGQNKPYFSFKVQCAAIEEMPLPRPLYEIFVYSPRFEAVHLRGGKIARGGLRWSDRREDFRTEVLGLVKAQMVKNAVIVPTGSKGGFILKKAPQGDREAFMKEGVACYQNFIRGLLDITDNLVKGKVVSPANVVRWDEDDTYLVVAADKGTATFSDFANGVSQEYGFWLGDAFASGGSQGYDHKKMGITAKGAWESVRRHFREMGMNADEDPITVVGIGDMAGDVFGNGMLCSSHMKLVAAFNHMHIFIDPTPNPEISFQERKRLFELPRSSWADYNGSLISKGGGIFERRSKSVTLTHEIKHLLGLTQDSIHPDELVRTIMKAQVDLIWFGGIGTFIKAREESNADVGDRANDNLRVNGREIRAKVIAEGANLGVTQLGRIEYAKSGGRLNTDAIDNSAGVDCSDHEVNIKILLGLLRESGKINLEKRNEILVEMTDNVSKLVLKDNFFQNQTISLAQSQGVHLLDEQARLMRDLEQQGLLDRTMENLPDDIEISRRLADKHGLTRPELSVLLAYAKIALNKALGNADILESSLLEERVQQYFPAYIQQHYPEAIPLHPLKRGIINMRITNAVVNRMGMTFVNEMHNETGREIPQIVQAYLVVRKLLNLSQLWRDIESLEALSTTTQNELMLYVYKVVKRFTGWFLRGEILNDNPERQLQDFEKGFVFLEADPFSYLPIRHRDKLKKKLAIYADYGLPEALAMKLISLDPLISAPDISVLTQKTGQDMKWVAQIYFAIGESYGFDWVRAIAGEIPGENRWQKSAVATIIDELYLSQKSLTLKIISSHSPQDCLLTTSGHFKEEFLKSPNVEKLLADLMSAPSVDLAMLTVANRELGRFAEGGLV
ncbi:NAD-specific glutamate dehydrogenase [Candidatus Bealeia paramacronuclearis]|uniref:NAD-specific glutamate dehydrogenase n=1 Tax=Candidatus Bealeia paramacronuclearis TaxID=1921001 RepID=A0ABZ2C2N4_9PROT|nr:NAD-specific glutamate dehydrogenase [Candidatus Bealeia paramacronuclearis]